MNKPKYKDYEKLINLTAWKFHQKTSAEYEDLCSIAKVVFFEKRDQHNPEKCRFSTFIANQVRYAMLDYWKKEVENEKAKQENTKKIETTFFENFIEDTILFSENVKTILDIIFNINKRKFKNKKYHYPKHSPPSKRAIRKELYSIGWSKKKIKKTFTEIQEMI